MKEASQEEIRKWIKKTIDDTVIVEIEIKRGIEPIIPGEAFPSRDYIDIKIKGRSLSLSGENE